jgi:hypothetical protein
MIFAQKLTVDRAQALWDLGRRLNRGLTADQADLNDAADACGHVVRCADHGTPALAVDEEGRVFAVNVADGSYVVRIGRVFDGMFRESEWAQAPS